jgi:hypothetical protein
VRRAYPQSPRGLRQHLRRTARTFFSSQTRLSTHAYLIITTNSFFHVY